MIEHFKSLRCGQISNSFFCAVFLRDLSVCAIFYTFSNYAIKMKRKSWGNFVKVAQIWAKEFHTVSYAKWIQFHAGEGDIMGILL